MSDPAGNGNAGLQRECNKSRVPGRPWPKGTSGNPSGRRKGTLSPTAALRRALTKADLEQIAAKLIEQAKAGDRHALRIVFDRLDGPLNQVNYSVNGQVEAGESRETVILWPHEVEEKPGTSASGG